MYRRAKMGIGYLAQEASVFRSMSVEDNILSVSRNGKFIEKDQLDKCESLLDEFGLQLIRKNKGGTSLVEKEEGSKLLEL